MVIWSLPLLAKSEDGATLARFTRFDRRLERGMRTWLVHAALKTAVESKQTRELERVPGLYRGRQDRHPNNCFRRTRYPCVPVSIVVKC